MNVLVGQVAHLFHIDFFKECSHIDALDDLHDLLVKLLVVDLELLVLFDELCVVRREIRLLRRQPLPLGFKL